MKNIDDLLKGDYDANLGQVLQEILGRVTSNNLLATEALRRLIVLEKRQEGLIVDDEEVKAELSELCDRIDEIATDQVRSLTAKWHLESGD